MIIVKKKTEYNFNNNNNGQALRLLNVKESKGSKL